MTRRGLFLSLIGGLAAAPLGDAWAARRDRPGLRYGPDPRQTVEMHVPRGAAGLPVLVVFDDRRGGGRRIARQMARRGFVVALANLRMVRGSGAAMVADAAVATAWVADRASEYGGDAARLGVLGLGRSADAALMIALDRRYMAAMGRPDLIRAAGALERPPETRRDLTATRPEAYVRAGAAPLWLGGRDQAATMLAARIEAVGGWVQSLVLSDEAGLVADAAVFFGRELA